MESSFKSFMIGFIIVIFITIGFAFVVNNGYMNGVFSQFSSSSSVEGLANSSWAMEGHDKKLTEQTNIIGPQSNNTKWTFDLGNWIASPPSIGPDGTIYILAVGNRTNNNDSYYNITSNNNATISTMINGTNVTTINNNFTDNGPLGEVPYSTINTYFLFAINPNGTLKWETNYTMLLGSGQSAAPLIAKDGTIYIGANGDDNGGASNDSKNGLYAIDPNGNLKWQFNKDFIGSNGINIGSDGTIYACNKRLYAINPNGTLKWKSDMVGASRTPAIGSDGTIYFLGGNELYAYKPDGTLKWHSSTGNGGTTNPPSIGPDGTIYITTNSFHKNTGGYDFYAFNQDGSTKWIFTSNSSLYGGYETYPDGYAPSVGSDGTIYTSVSLSTTGYIYSLNSNGEMKWKNTTENGDFINSPFLIDSKGTIYYISDQIYAEYPNQTIKWESHINNPGTLGYLAMGNDGTLYATTETSQYLYAIGP